MSDFEYINMRRVTYGRTGAHFIPVCKDCGRFVRPDREMSFNMDGDPSPGPNSTCKKCGRVEMIFEGFYDPEDILREACR